MRDESGRGERALDGVMGLEPEIGAEDRARLTEATVRRVLDEGDARQWDWSLSARSADLLDAWVEGGWRSDAAPGGVLGAIGAVGVGDGGDLAGRTMGAVEADGRNPFGLELPVSGEAVEPTLPRWAARVGAMAAALLLASAMFVPGLRPGVDGMGGGQGAGVQFAEPAAAGDGRAVGGSGDVEREEEASEGASEEDGSVE